ncbi:hypothetical protein D918_07128 [Trichuris suis]|nr:hypothetical protein D918_07128 [Trichuris suis]
MNTGICPDDTKRCYKHEDCSGMIAGSFRAMCIRQRCVWASPTRYTCPRRNFCRLGEACIGDLCYEPFDGTNVP